MVTQDLDGMFVVMVQLKIILLLENLLFYQVMKVTGLPQLGQILMIVNGLFMIKMNGHMWVLTQ